MQFATMSVAERIGALKKIFNDFGIEVAPGSSLEQAIQAEFGRGKRSKITPLLLDLHRDTDAARLAKCIATELQANNKDPQVLAVANVLQTRLPPLLEILDIRQSVDKRMDLLSQLLRHFANKIPDVPQSERLLRMLDAAQRNIQAQLQVTAIGKSAEQIGLICNISDIQKFGRILQGITPALIAVDQDDYPLEQKINHCVHGLRCIAAELRSNKLYNYASILEELHWLARLVIPRTADPVTVEQGLRKLGISVGNISLQMIANKAQKIGLTQQEIAQIIYALAPADKLAGQDQLLLNDTHSNQRYAAICGFAAHLAQDLKQPELAKIGIAGICLASLRQTYCELKSKNLNGANFSESLGTILLGAGAITENSTLTNVGQSILTGVQAYSGLMAVPGGATVAIPLAVCTVLGKMYLDSTKGNNGESPDQTQEVLNAIVNEVFVLHQQMRSEFADLYREIYANHREVLYAVDQGFANLEKLVRMNNVQNLNMMRAYDERLRDLQVQISQEFSDLYLEYIHDPLDEISFAKQYAVTDQARLQKNKQKLALWLLYKSKHPKINGGGVPVSQLSQMCVKLQHTDAVLCMINRYVNAVYAQSLPEDLPHVPSWILAAGAYVIASNMHALELGTKEDQLLSDIESIGHKILDFIQQLSTNSQLWEQISSEVAQSSLQLQNRWNVLQTQIAAALLNPVQHVCKNASAPRQIIAQSSFDTEQLEYFTPVLVDITDIWHAQIAPLLPEECIAAVAYGLAEWQIKFSVDKQHNSFTEVHIPYGNTLLPDSSRDVFFKIEVHFKQHRTQDTNLLCTTWMAYDLVDSKQRFDQYYQQKFKYGLKHSRYYWISPDGMSNQVEGHGITKTHKLIDHDRLANIYKNWLIQAKPIVTPEINARVQHNPRFSALEQSAFAANESTILATETILALRVNLQNELCTEMLKQRVLFAGLLQQDTVLVATLEKLDVLFAICTVYMRILNKPFMQQKIFPKFNELITAMQQPENLHRDFALEFQELFNLTHLDFTIDDSYLTGDFVQQIQAVTSRLSLLKTKAVEQRLVTSRPL